MISSIKSVNLNDLLADMWIVRLGFGSSKSHGINSTGRFTGILSYFVFDKFLICQDSGMTVELVFFV